MGSVNFGEDVYINRLPDIRYWAKRMRQTKTVLEEDSIFWAPDQAVKRNVELVLKLAQLVRLLGHAVATPAEARAILGIRRV